MTMDKQDSIAISLRIPRDIYATLYKAKGQVQIKSLQAFIVKAIEEKLERNNLAENGRD